MITGPAWGIGGDDDTGMHALETDVMRFMAILAFCLLAIFALVQSVPWSAAPPVVVAPAAVDDPAPNDASPATPVPPPVADAKILDRPEPAVGIPKKARPRSMTPAPQLQKEPSAVARLEPESREPVTGKSPKAEIPAEPRPLNATVGDITRETMPVDPVIPSWGAVPMPPLSNPAIAPGPADTVSAGAESAEARRATGFLLRFESDEAMFDLIEAGGVSLFALGEGSTWRLAASGGRFSFHAVAAPKQIYEMTPATVPADLLRALRRRASVPTNHVTWGVVLPAMIRSDIERLMRDSNGGRLLIQSDGRVRLD